MRVIVFTFICYLMLSSSGNLLGQMALPKTTDVDTYIKIADQAQLPDSAIWYYSQALNLSRDIDYKDGLKKALRGLSEIEKKNGNPAAALRSLLELIKVLEKEENPKALCEAYMSVATIYQNEELYEKALEYYQLARSTSPEEYTLNDLHYLIGDAYEKINELDSALFFFNFVRNFYVEKGEASKKLQTLQRISDVYTEQEDHAAALAVNQQILAEVELSGRPKDLAVIYNNIGYNYNYLKDYDEAADYFRKTLSMCKQEKYVDMINLYTNLGIAYNNLGKLRKSIDYLKQAAKEIPKKDKHRQIFIDQLISTVYLNNGDVYNAYRYNERVLEDARRHQEHRLLGDGYNTAAKVHKALHEYEKALEYTIQYLELRDSFILADRLRQQDLLQQQYLLERAEKEIRLLLVNQEVKDLTINQLQLERKKLKLESEKLELEAKTRQDELALLKQEGEIQEVKLKNSELAAQKALQEQNLAQQQLLAERRDREISELQQKEKLQQLELAQKQAEEKERQAEIDVLTKEKKLLTQEQEINQLQLEKDQERLSSVYRIIGLMSVILLMILAVLIYASRANKKLAQKNNLIEQQKVEIEHERNESDRLLLNVLPEETAHELKEKGTATPKNYDQVTVLFTDFSGFTKVAATMAPEKLIQELGICFKEFDEIIEKFNLEKIKTIGDSYMCAGGIPKPNSTSPVDAISAGIEMQKFMNQRIKEKEAAGIPYWGMRVGIHTGPVVAGVVGSKKFAYDIWGDTVNTASRMESSCIEGKINISEDTHQLIKDHFRCSYRGEIEVKHKGKVKMFFVD